MMKVWTPILSVGLLASAALALYVGAARQGPPANPAQGRALERVQQVRTVAVRVRDVPVEFSAEGHVVPVNQVEIRPQITSTVTAIRVREGSEVEAGAVLFALDDREARAEVQRAQAQVTRDQALLADAQSQLARNEELLGKRMVAESVVESARSQVRSLQATLEADRSVVESARVALSYTIIRAPFAGRVGAVNVYPGSLVQPNSTQPMTVITQFDPIAVAFTLTESELAAVRALPGDQAVGVTVVDGGRTLAGRLSFIDNSIDPQTGTIRLKAEFPNPERRLWPGQFVRLRLQAGLTPGAATLPAAAVQTGPEGRFVYVVQGDGTVAAQPVKLLRVFEQQAVVEGVTGGARVVLEGAENLRPGSKVLEAGEDGPAPATAG
ncbi:MAG TPA: efflux RND transporter periplasmic adaptor subunit [Candidatus Competibacteraceae bacterium]|nr:efflux RND transporter periplasmic adaptor subunit [Candidatus Competibacteraceae bacterium]